MFHRDVKTANVLLFERVAKLCDFGKGLGVDAGQGIATLDFLSLAFPFGHRS